MSHLNLRVFGYTLIPFSFPFLFSLFFIWFGGKKKVKINGDLLEGVNYLQYQNLCTKLVQTNIKESYYNNIRTHEILMHFTL